MRQWRESFGQLHKKFKFSNFTCAIDFVNKVASIAESMNHHPNILILYDVVVLRIKTHDVNDGKGGITELDYKFTSAVDNLKLMK